MEITEREKEVVNKHIEGMMKYPPEILAHACLEILMRLAEENGDYVENLKSTGKMFWKLAKDIENFEKKNGER